jgi:hypothetical protein
MRRFSKKSTLLAAFASLVVALPAAAQPAQLPSAAAPGSAAEPAAAPAASAPVAADSALPTPSPPPDATAPAATAAPVPSHAPGGLVPPQPMSPGSSVRVVGGPYDGPPLLLGSGKLKVGAYGGLGVAYTRMLHRDGVVTDLELAVLIDHRVTLGAAGYVFSRTPRAPAAADGTPREYVSGYGGLLLRYAAFADFPVYASFGVLVGGGVVTRQDRARYDYRSSDAEDDYDPHAHEQNEGFFMVQPDLSLHANATRWLRFSLTGGYRFASGVSRFGYDSTALSGAVAGGNVELGWF